MVARRRGDICSIRHRAAILSDLKSFEKNVPHIFAQNALVAGDIFKRFQCHHWVRCYGSEETGQMATGIKEEHQRL